jgi:putative transposase
MSHSFTNVLVHVVFSTKGREPWLSLAVRRRLFGYMRGLARNEFGDCLKLGGVEDHLHGAIVLRADISVAHALSRWKSLSSGWIHRTFPDLREFAWQEGYGAFSVSRSNLDVVMRYIDGQVDHHKHMTFHEELVALLQRHGIEFDPQRVLD